MPAAITDYFTKASSGTRPVPTTTTATVASGASPGTITCAALTGWATTTPVHFIIYTTDANANKVAGSQIDCKGIVVGNTITGTVVKAGTNLGFSVGAIVEAAPTAAYADDLATGLAVSHNADGSLSTTAVNTALGLSSTIGAGWTPLAQTFTYGANNGNKEFTVTATADLTSVLSPGMRMQLTRGTTAPTQSMSFTAASSQFASKTTPAGITFTSDWTFETWVYLNSYPAAGGSMGLLSRDATTSNGSGFEVNIGSTGQISPYWRNATGATSVATYQSIPLKRWVHVATVASVASASVAIYINGVFVGVQVIAAGATTLVQSTASLTLGDRTGTAHGYLDGYMSETRLWATAKTQGQIQASMGINLVGNETNLVALFKGNGNFTDTTANANTLTASGGAIATNLGNPYNNVEYANIVSVSYSAPTTTVTLQTGDYGTIPSMTLSSPQYSALFAPIGFPSALHNPCLGVVEVTTAFSTSSTTFVPIPGASVTVTIPSGGRRVRASISAQGGVNSSVVYYNLGIFRGTQQIAFSRNWSSTAGRGVNIATTVIDTPPGGSATYTVQLAQEGGGTATVQTGPPGQGLMLMIEPA